MSDETQKDPAVNTDPEQEETQAPAQDEPEASPPLPPPAYDAEIQELTQRLELAESLLETHEGFLNKQPGYAYHKSCNS
jgi:hypothetical protein